MPSLRLIALSALLPLLGAMAASAQPAPTPSPTAPAASPTTKPNLLNHIQVDIKNKIVRIDCEVCKADYGLEFFCVSSGGNEYESVLRSEAKPSGLHLALLMVGLEPGEPVKYAESTNRWIPPHGPPLEMSCQFEKDGKTITVPANRLMRNNKTHKEVSAMTWIFSGSKIMEDGNYGADPAGYLVSVLNNELSVIDIPVLAGRALETREWEPNADLLPPPGSKVTLIIEPAGKAIDPKLDNPAEVVPVVSPTDKTQPEKPISADPAPTTQSIFAARLAAAEKLGTPLDKVTMDADGKVAFNAQPFTLVELTEKLKQLRGAGNSPPLWFVYDPTSKYEQAARVIQAIRDAGIDLAPENVGSAATEQDATASDIAASEARIKALKDRWIKAVAPHQEALRQAAQAHYEVIESLRREQNKLIDEADRIQRVIDELSKDYDSMTTPHPETGQSAGNEGK